MPYISHTTIETTSPQQAPAALVAHARGTARGSSAFPSVDATITDIFQEQHP